VIIWLPSYFAFSNVNTWQLIINTVTTIVTFLLVALLQNSQKRSDEAVQDKLNAIADGLADVLAAQRGETATSPVTSPRLRSSDRPGISRRWPFGDVGACEISRPGDASAGTDRVGPRGRRCLTDPVRTARFAHRERAR
jgi:hypothetical protein